jgi:hypothetical protein
MRNAEMIRRAVSAARILVTLRAQSNMSILYLSSFRVARLTGSPCPKERPRRSTPSFETNLASLPIRAGLGAPATVGIWLMAGISSSNAVKVLQVRFTEDEREHQRLLLRWKIPGEKGERKNKKAGGRQRHRQPQQRSAADEAGTPSIALRCCIYAMVESRRGRP